MKEAELPDGNAKWDVWYMQVFSWLTFIGILWVSSHTIPDVIDIDRSFTRHLGHSDSSPTVHLADRASDYGAILVRYRVPFVAVSYALPLLAVGAMFCGSRTRSICLVILFAAAVCVCVFIGVAMISST